MTLTATAPVATEKQVAFLNKLLATKDLGDIVVPEDVTTIGRKDASYLIDSLLARPTAKGATPQGPKVEFVPGAVYNFDGDIYRIKQGQSGHVYAMKLVLDLFSQKGSWTFAKGALKFLAKAQPLTLEEAKAYGATTGFCCVCGRLLTNEKSVADGIGPICASKF